MRQLSLGAFCTSCFGHPPFYGDNDRETYLKFCNATTNFTRRNGRGSAIAQKTSYHISGRQRRRTSHCPQALNHSWFSILATGSTSDLDVQVIANLQNLFRTRFQKMTQRLIARASLLRKLKTCACNFRPGTPITAERFRNKN